MKPKSGLVRRSAAPGQFGTPMCGSRRTFFQLAYGHHAMVGRELPDAQGSVITDSGTDWQQGVGGQTPHLTLHVTLKTHTHTPTDTHTKHIHTQNPMYTGESGYYLRPVLQSSVSRSERQRLQTMCFHFPNTFFNICSPWQQIEDRYGTRLLRSLSGSYAHTHRH